MEWDYINGDSNDIRILTNLGNYIMFGLKKKKDVKDELSEIKGGVEEPMGFKAVSKLEASNNDAPKMVQAQPKRTQEVEVRVVRELPLQPVREAVDEETGKLVKFITIEEYLTKLANDAGSE